MKLRLDRKLATWLAVVLCLTSTLAGCARFSPGPGSAVGSVAQAQTRVGFPIATPGCVPSDVSPSPIRVAVGSGGREEGQSVYIDYGYRDPSAYPTNGFPALAFLEQPSQQTRGILIQSGEHQVLDGTEVVIDTSTGAPSLEWIEVGTVIQLVATVSLDDALRVYHSMVTHSSSCGLPSKGG